MAIQFLAGITVDGNITLSNTGQFKKARIDNQTADPSGANLLGDGQIYYNTGTDKMRLRANGAWVDFTTGSDANTTYDLSGVGSSNGTAGVRLAGSDGTNDDVLVVGAGTVAVTRSGNTLTVTGTDSAAGTVTSVSGGTGITVSGSATVTPTVNIDYLGSDNAILAATGATPVGGDTMWFSDATDSTIKKALISAMPGFGKDGTVTAVGSGAGLTGGTINSSGTLAVDYAGVDNVVLAAADGTSVTLAGTDKVLFSDATDNNAKFSNLSQVASFINAGAGSVTSVGVSGGSTGFAFSSSPITSSGTMTMSGTLSAPFGGTGNNSYTAGDILYADSSTSLKKLSIGSAGQVLKVASGLPSWATDQNSGGTVTSITNAADSGSGSAITGSGTFTYTGGTNVTTSVSGTTVTINTSATTNTGTVTSVATGNGISGGTITTSGTLTVSGGDGLNQTSTGLEVDATVVRTSGVQTIGGVKQFTALPKIPVTPSAGTDAASKSYVDLSISGSGALIFQGAYDASTAAPSGAAVLKGFTYVVTVAGTGVPANYWSPILEVGDLIIANKNAPTSAADWTEVNKNVDVASTTTPGIASFSSASFAVSAVGQVTVKAGGISDAQLASTFNKIIGIDTDINTSGIQVVDQISLTDGVVQTLNTRSLPTTSESNLGVIEMANTAEVTAGTLTNKGISPATLKEHLDVQGYTQTFPLVTGASTSILASLHKLGTGPLIIQCYSVVGGGQVQLDVTVASNGTVTLGTTGSQLANSLRVAMMKVR